jgi:hypothetical protein
MPHRLQTLERLQGSLIKACRCDPPTLAVLPRVLEAQRLERLPPRVVAAAAAPSTEGVRRHQPGQHVLRADVLPRCLQARGLKRWQLERRCRVHHANQQLGWWHGMVMPSTA